MTAFLELTRTHSLALRIALLSSEKEARQKYAFCGALSPSCYDDLFYALEEGFLDRSTFNVFCHGLFYIGRQQDAVQLEQMACKIFGFVSTPDPRESAYQKSETRKRKNDLNFICSRKALRNAIIRLFKIAGNENIKNEMLHSKFDEDNPRNTINSSLLTNFISEQAQESTVTLQSSLQAIDDDLYFNIWRADQLMNGYLKRFYPEVFQDLLKNYYQEEIVSFPFSKVTIESPYLVRKQAGQLMEIWAEYQWPTNDDILLEFVRINTENYGHIRFAEINKRKSLTSLLLKHFSDRRQLLKTRIMQNLRSGLKNQQVMGSHFELCRELHIREAVPFILDAIKGKKCETHYLDDYITLYISLGGNLAELLPIFEAHKDLNDYLFMFMVKQLEQQYPAKAIERLLACLRSANTDSGRKVEAAQRLAQLGNKEGFSYLISTFEPGKPAPFDIQGKVSIWNVDTGWGLEQLRSLMHIVLDEKTEQLRFYHSPKYLILEILNGFAGKNAAHLESVTMFMHECVSDLTEAYPKNAGHLAWHAEQMIERNCQITATPLSNRQIKQLFRQITD